MTILEEVSLEAFRDLLSHSGKSLSVGGQSVDGLVEYIEPENAQYTLEDGEGQDSIVKVLKTEWPTGKERVGTTFEITGEAKFRIKTSRFDGIFFVFRCEVY